MVDTVLERIQGNELLIDQVTLKRRDTSVELEIRGTCNNEIINLLFENISSLSLKDFSYPLVIAGIEFIDNSQRGWEISKRYRVHDYEYETIDFYCESILYLG